MRLVIYFTSIVCLCFATALKAQQFVNGDFEGVAHATAQAPEGWTMVSNESPICNASSFQTATIDILSPNGPNSGQGIRGTASSGISFVSGLMAENENNGFLFHEGLKQDVSGFAVGAAYEIEFMQAVVKQSNARDVSGAWEVFVDEESIGVTQISIDTSSSPISLNQIWEARSVSFTATNETHSIAFMPWDNDNFQTFSATSLIQALRMGIDDVRIINCFVPLDLNPNIILCGENDVTTIVPQLPPGTIATWSTGDSSLFINVDEPGTYTLDVLYGGCLGSAETEVIQVDIPNPDLGEDILICEGESVVLSSQYSEGNFLWIGQNSTAPSIEVNTGGNYTINVEQFGCVGSDNVFVEVQVPLTNFDWDEALYLCPNEEIAIEIDEQNLVWDEFGETNNVSITSTGSYSFSFTMDACDISSQIVVLAMDPPQLELGENMVFCESSPQEIEVTLDEFTTVSWSNGSTENQISPNSTAWYSATFSNQCGSTIDSVYVEIQSPIELDLGEDIVVCDNSPQSFEVDPSWTTWWFDGSEGSTFTTTSSGLIGVNQSNTCGTFSDEVNVIYITPPQGLSLPEVGILCSGSEYSIELFVPEGNDLLINGQASNQYSTNEPGTIEVQESNVCGTWSDSFELIQIPFPPPILNDTLVCNRDTLRLFPPELWYVEINDIALIDSLLITEASILEASLELEGCVYEESAFWDFYECSYELAMPNVFTPNQDGDNELFRPLIMTGTVDLELEIYNRWGQLLYHKRGMDSAWDGRLSGDPAPEGIYFYRVRSKDDAGRWYEQSGHLTLLR